MKKQKIMRSMKFRENLPSALEDVRFRETEIIITHYDEPVAKVVGLTEKEKSQFKEVLKNDF